MNAFPSAIAIPVIPPHPAGDSRWLAEWECRDFLELGAQVTAPGAARGIIRERLTAWGLDGLTDVVELVATELVTNSVAATREVSWDWGEPPVRMWLLGAPASVAVLVWDGVPGMPVRRVAGNLDESGRGLGIVAALSRQWDSYFPPFPFGGKVTWAFITTENTKRGE
jgi:hypothetical protein